MLAIRIYRHISNANEIRETKISAKSDAAAVTKAGPYLKGVANIVLLRTV